MKVISISDASIDFRYQANFRISTSNLYRGCMLFARPAKGLMFMYVFHCIPELLYTLVDTLRSNDSYNYCTFLVSAHSSNWSNNLSVHLEKIPTFTSTEQLLKLGHCYQS